MTPVLPDDTALDFGPIHVTSVAPVLNDSTFGAPVGIEICLDRDTSAPSLFRVQAFGRTLTDVLSAQGLEEALGGDVSRLEVVLRDESLFGNAANKIRLKGFTAASASFIGVLSTLTENGREDPVGAATVGKLVPGAAGFPSGMVPLTPTTITLGSASFTFEGETALVNTPGTNGYRVRRLNVVDENAALPPERRGREVVLEGDALAAAFRYGVGHHNDCDSFYLKLPDAEYAATSFKAMSWCGHVPTGRILPEAPLPPEGDAPHGTLFKVKYGSEGWSPVQQATCRFAYPFFAPDCAPASASL
jgi:hypothetical protein